jgi:hypothetical protein
MAIVPRLRDSLRVEQTDDGEYRIIDREGSELFRLTGGGYFLLQQLDGVSSTEEVLSKAEAELGEALPVEELDGWIQQLDAAGALVRDSRAIRILAYLKTEGIELRRPTVDRRAGAERGAPRRDLKSNIAPWFDYAVVLLNDGRLEDGLDVFERMSEARPEDVRLQEIVLHLRFIQDAERVPDLEQDRRDVTWEAFDAALLEMLLQGRCPRCGESFTVSLGGGNRCWSCGGGFTAWLIEQPSTERRER